MAATNQTPGSLSLAATSPGMVKRLSFVEYAKLQRRNRQDVVEYKPSQSKLKVVASLLPEDMVRLFVGPKRKRYHVHEDLLCDRSEYFRAMFQGGYSETQNKEVFLVDEAASVMELFITWIYGTALRGSVDANESSAYLGLLVLSEKFLIEQLHNECIDLIRAYFRDDSNPVRAQDVRYVYDNLNDQKLCQFLIRLMAKAALSTQALARTLGHNPPALPQECQLLIRAGGDCAMNLASLLTIGLGFLKKHEDTSNYNCVYHGHSSTEKCHGPEVEYDAFRGPVILQPPKSRSGENKT